MRILRVIRSLNPQYGGPVEGIKKITPLLDSFHFETTVATLDSPESPWLTGLSFRSVALGPVLSGYGFRFDLVKVLSELASSHDLVIIHGLWQYHSLATWLAVRLSSTPYYVYPHGMLDPWFKHAYPIKHLKKIIYWFLFESRVIRDSSSVLFTSMRECQLARLSFPCYSPEEHVVGYGTTSPPSDVESQQQVFLNAFPSLCGKRVLLFLSRIHPKKGVDILITAFAQVASSDPRLHLVIAGPDLIGWQPYLKQLSSTLGISHRITWAGMLSGTLKWGAFRSAELFCLPSHQENFGIVVAEALSCGLPVLITNAVNISTEISLSGAGLVHSDSLEGTLDGLKLWISLPKHSQAAMGLCALELFREKFDLTSVACTLASLFRSQHYHQPLHSHNQLHHRH